MTAGQSGRPFSGARHGWLLRFDCTAGGRMARAFGRLISRGAFCALLLVAALFAPNAFAAICTLPSQGAVMAQCQSEWSSNPGVGCAVLTQADPKNGTPGNIVAYIKPSTANVVKSYGFCVSGIPPEDQCKARPSYNTAIAGNISVCRGGCSYSPDPNVEQWTVKGVTTKATSGGGGRMVPSGGVCGDGPENATDGQPKSEPIPKLCGGGSCLDTQTGIACGLNSAGAQVCVNTKGQGACASGGDTTLCAGKPAPLPPNPPITDPATQIVSSDQYTSQTGNGPINNTTVNNYNNTGNSPNSGKGPGDTDGSGNKPDDQKKDDGTSASGGGDCNTAPMVEGSAALAMIARQTWLLRCADSGQGADDSDKSVPGLDGIGEKPGDGFNKEISVIDKLDFSGFGGGGQCPRLPDVDLGAFGHLSLNSDWWCEMLWKLSFLIVALGVWAALTILGSK